jgi:hypothetical protein
MDTLAVARRAVAALPPTVRDRAFRGDSACYDETLLKYLVREQIAFTISADMSPELRKVCADPAIAWALLEDRVTETVRVAEVEFTPGAWPKQAHPLRYVAIEIRPRQGTLCTEPRKYLAVVSNRGAALAPAALVRWHWEKAGTIEFVHDVSKNDLAAGVPPSGKFGANAAWYRLTLLTYNVLTVLRRLARTLSARPAQAPALRGVHNPRRNPHACAAAQGAPRGPTADGRRTRRRSWAAAGLAHGDLRDRFRPAALERFYPRARPRPACSQARGVAYLSSAARSARGLRAFLGKLLTSALHAAKIQSHGEPESSGKISSPSLWFECVSPVASHRDPGTDLQRA